MPFQLVYQHISQNCGFEIDEFSRKLVLENRDGGVRAHHFMQRHGGCQILLQCLVALIEADELDSAGDSLLNDLGRVS